MRYHLRWYNEHPKTAKEENLAPADPKKKKKKEFIPAVADYEGALRLSFEKKSAILLNNIFGVDLDPQAVEVAQLSLYLKLLEEETTASARQHYLDFHEALLPPLTANIKCGNSLIGTDIMWGKVSLTVDEERKLRPFDFESAFPQVFGANADGNRLREHDDGWLFELGHPPVTDVHYKQALKGKAKGQGTIKRPMLGGFDAIVGNPPYVRPHHLTAQTKEYFWDHYPTFTHKADLYCCFMEKAASLLKSGGRFSYIVSHGWLRLNSFQVLRRFVLDQFRIDELVQFPYRVFAEAQVDTGIFVFEKGVAARTHEIEVIRAEAQQDGAAFETEAQIKQIEFRDTFQNVFDLSKRPELDAVKSKMASGPMIGAEFDICFGLKTGDDTKFLHHQVGLHNEDRPLLRGDDVKRYSVSYKGEFVWYVPDQMREHRKTARPGEAARFEQPKVLVKDTSKSFAGTFDPSHYYVKDVLIVIPHSGRPPKYDLRFLAGLVNSKALHFYYRTTFQTIHVQSGELGSLPLPSIDFANKQQRAQHDRMVQLVEAMLKTQEQRASAKSERDQSFYADKCAALDHQIDQLVYELYDLTPEEIALVEGAGAAA